MLTTQKAITFYNGFLHVRQVVIPFSLKLQNLTI